MISSTYPRAIPWWLSFIVWDIEAASPGPLAMLFSALKGLWFNWFYTALSTSCVYLNFLNILETLCFFILINSLNFPSSLSWIPSSLFRAIWSWLTLCDFFPLVTLLSLLWDLWSPIITELLVVAVFSVERLDPNLDYKRYWWWRKKGF